MREKNQKRHSDRMVPSKTSRKQLAQEAAQWEARVLSPKDFEDAPDAIPRVAESTAISLRMPSTLLEVLRAFAKREGVGYQVLIKRWLDDRLRQERERIKDSTSAWLIKPGETAPFLDADGTRAAAFIHLRVFNHTVFTPRVRGWVRFCNQQGADLCKGEMPIRWSSRPEPLMWLPVMTSPTSIEYKLVPDLALSQNGYVTDFAAREEQEFAFAIKMRDGTCWGWTQESYLHGWRHPKWKLPAGRLVALVRLLAGGQEYRAKFQLDTEESIDEIVVRGSEGSVGVQGAAATAHLAEVIPLRRGSG